MPVFGKLMYQSSRELAGFTQEQAAELLGVGTSTLTRYENGHYPVPSDVVATMCKLYRAPTLALWHVRYANPELDLYFPESQEIKTSGDFMLQAEYANDDMSGMRACLKEILREKVTAEETEQIRQMAKRYRCIAGKAVEFAAYLDQLVIKTMREG